MRVMNDKEERKEPIEIDLLAVISQGFLCSLGMATFMLSPLPIIHSHLKLVNPWPKVATLLGAILAISVLELPVMPVVLSFVVGIFLADNYSNEVPFWKNFSGSVMVGLLIGFGALFLNASMEKLSVLQYWSQLVGNFITVAQDSVKLTDSTFQWEELKTILIYQGPYFFTSSIILMFWFNVGMAAHLGWVTDTHAYSARSLRTIKLPQSFSVLFLGLFVLNSAQLGPVHHLVAGIFRVLGTLLFVQGTITLSNAMTIKGVKRGTRAVVYVFACTVAFYAVVGLGVLSPWFFKKNGKRLAEVPSVKLEEVSV